MFARTLNAERSASKQLSRPIGICEEIKQRISITWLWRCHGFAGNPKPGGRCRNPFYTDNNPDFFISKDDRWFFDHGSPDYKGDVITFEMFASGCSPGDAIRKLRELVNMPINQHRQLPVDRGTRHHDQGRKKLRPLALDFLKRGTVDDLKRLADLRCLAPEALAVARDVGVLRFATLKGQRAWIVTDQARVVAEARRLDGQPWRHIGNKKAWTLPGGNKKWPLGILEAQNCRAIVFVEGAPDFLSGYHLIWAANCDVVDAVAPVTMLGSSLIHAVALPFFSNKRVRIFAHFDPEKDNGERTGAIAAAEWGAQLKSVGAGVDYFDFSGLTRSDGQVVRDLNDLCLVSYDDWETTARVIMP